MSQKPSQTNVYRIKTRTDRALVPTEKRCQRYLYLVLTAPAAPYDFERPQLNLSLILDRSGSMSGDKLAFVKQAAEHAIRLLNEQDRASVIIYDDQVDLLSPSQEMNSVNRERAIRTMRSVRTGGMTNLSGGWLTGCDQIADHQRSEAINRALLLTDGLANQGITDLEELAAHAKALFQRGIATTTLGVGNDFNEFLLQALADAGGGHFYFIDSPDQISHYFQGELGEMLDTVARETTLHLELPEGTKLELVNDIPHQIDNGSLRLFIGDVFSGQTHEFVLRLDLPARTRGETLRTTPRVTYYDVARQRSEELWGEPIVFTTADSSQVSGQTVDEDVLAVASRLEVEKAKLKAVRLEREGQAADARALLRGAARAVAAFAPAPLAQAAQHELEELEEAVDEGLDEAQRKAVSYGAYRVHHSRRDYKK